VSLESIKPIPASSSESLAGIPPVPDLSTLRQGWSERKDTPSKLPSIPVSTSIPASQQAKTETAKIPTLPEHGNTISQADFSIDALDDLITRAYPDQSTKLPNLNSVAGLDAIPAETESSTHPEETEFVPLVAFPTSHAASNIPAALPVSELDTMPITKSAEVSLPLARDQFVFPVEKAQEPAQEPVEATTFITPHDDISKQPATEEEKIQPNLESEDKPLIDRISPPEASSEPITPQRGNYTDEDLRDALQPMINQSVDKFLYTPSHGVHTYLEPMLRSTVRRAIAEQMDDISPFKDAHGWDKFAWKMRALFSSRSYDEIIFDHTSRYQVEEVFLLRRHTRSLISYASNDPSRHASVKKVQGTVKKVAAKCSGNEEIDSSAKWEEKRHLMIRRGKHCTLAAIVNGSSNAILKSDLDYALRQAEERFGKSLEENSDIHLQVLQPLLEGCLLIKAPSITN